MQQRAEVEDKHLHRNKEAEGFSETDYAEKEYVNQVACKRVIV
jgi:hypothetical protein